MRPLVTALFLTSLLASAAVRVDDLRCEYRANPLGIDVTRPRLAWRLVAPTPSAKGTRQTAYRIAVSSTPTGSPDLWDTGKVASDQSVQIPYAGKPLTSGLRVWWKVQVWDQTGTPSEWSQPAQWSMGLLTPADWQAQWIGKDEPTLIRNPASPFHSLTQAHWIWTTSDAPGPRTFRHTLQLPSTPVKRALAVMAAENRFDLDINGKPAGFGTWSAMPETIDIRHLLHPGENELTIKVQRAGGKRQSGVIGAITVEFATGQPLTLSTSAAWKPDSGDARILGPYGMAPWGDTGFTEERWLPARLLRKEFSATKPIRRATAYMSGMGLSELYINGAKAGYDVLSPGLTEYPKRALYVAYDVTSMLRPGRNALGVMLGNGRYYAPRITVPTTTKTYGYPKLLLQLEIEHTDGSTSRVLSDASWRLTTDGPVRGNNEYDGEVYDATLEMPGWSSPGFKDTAWQPAAIVSPAASTLTAQNAEPIRVTETIRPVKLTEPRPGVFIYDMGQNMVGWCRLRVTGRRGTTVRLRHAEALQPDGTLYTANLRSARAEDLYTLKGGAPETYEPRFTYHGFRYVELTGYPGTPTIGALDGRIVHDAMEPSGSFESSNALLNRLHKMTYWGMRGNYRSIPTDCPQRDERQGWMGDRSQVSRSETNLFNVAAFYSKWITDIADAQRDDGAVSDVNPSYWPFYNNNVTWPSTFIIVPGVLYEEYGDTRVIERNFDAMKKWMNFMQTFMKDDLLPKDTYGDWCVPPESPELIHSKDPARQTDKTLLATAYFHFLAARMAAFAKLVNRPSDESEFTALANRLRTAFEKKFFNSAKGLYDNGTQTSSLLPLAFNMTAAPERPRVVDALVNRIHTESNDHIGTGLIGAQWLMRVLSDNGHPDLAYKIATQKTYPGWGYMIEKDATTVWELWNGDTADPAMNSANHVMQIGDLTIWMYEYLGGIRPDPEKPGFKHIILNPVTPAGLDSVSVVRKTQYGEIRSSWRRHEGKVEYKFTIPPNTTATFGRNQLEPGTYVF